MLTKTICHQPRQQTIVKAKSPLHSAAVPCWATLMVCTVLTTTVPAYAKALPTNDLTVQYRVYAFGLPTWFDDRVDVDFEKSRQAASQEHELMNAFH